MRCAICLSSPSEACDAFGVSRVAVAFRTSGEQHTVLHIFVKDWPDQLAPESGENMIKLYR